MRQQRFITPLHDTILEVEDYMSPTEIDKYSEATINLIAQWVDGDDREVCLQHKIYDAVNMENDLRMETL